MAVKVLVVAGARMLWVWAPESDQDLKLYILLPRVWGDGAEMVLLELTITVWVKGAGPVKLLKSKFKPLGLEAKVRITILGSSFKVVFPVAPCESVAVSSSCKYEGYSWSGALKEPDATPV